MPTSPGIRILTTCADDTVVRRAAAAFPRPATVDVVSASAIRRLEPADCLIVETADQARAARATGFEGGIVVIAAPRSEDESASFLLQGTHFARPDGGVEAVTGALGAAISVADDGSVNAVTPRVARMRRMLAAGELAVGLRHAFNNPLTALMAELQLLQMDVREPETRAAVERMLELVRRLSEVSRTLESVNDRPTGM